MTAKKLTFTVSQDLATHFANLAKEEGLKQVELFQKALAYYEDMRDLGLSQERERLVKSGAMKALSWEELEAKLDG